MIVVQCHFIRSCHKVESNDEIDLQFDKVILRFPAPRQLALNSNSMLFIAIFILESPEY